MRNRAMIAIGSVLALGIAFAWAEEEKVNVDQLPAKVLAAVKAKYPNAKLVAASKEEAEEASEEENQKEHAENGEKKQVKDAKEKKEEEEVLYEVEIDDQGVKISVSLEEDGKIVEIEKEIAEKDLPQAVRESLSKKFPGAPLKKVEEIAKDGKTNFEVVVVTAVELVLDGKGQVTKEEVKMAGDND